MRHDALCDLSEEKQNWVSLFLPQPILESFFFTSSRESPLLDEAFQFPDNSIGATHGTGSSELAGAWIYPRLRVRWTKGCYLEGDDADVYLISG